MVQLWISNGKFSKFARPPGLCQLFVDSFLPAVCMCDSRYHLIHKSFPRWLPRRERAQQAQQLCLARRVWLDLRLRIHIQQKQSQVSTATALSGFQQQLSAGREYVDRGIGVILLHVARGDDAEMLVRFVELAFFDSEATLSVHSLFLVYSGATRTSPAGAQWSSRSSTWRLRFCVYSC